MENYITKKKFEELVARAKHIREVDLPVVSKAKLIASQEGDLKENAGYHAAKEEMEHLGRELDELDEQLSSPNFIDDLKVEGDVVTLGTIVKVLDMKTKKEISYSILGPADADPDNDIISYQTPIARGMIRKKKGDECKIPTPGGIKKFKILKIKPYNK